MRAILIEGVAGSGKTTHITKLVRSLNSTTPALLLTFSKTGRDVMKSYLDKLNISFHYVFTIDSYALNLLNRLGAKKYLLNEEYVIKNILPDIYKKSVDQLYYSGYLQGNEIDVLSSNWTSLKALMRDMQYYRAAAAEMYDAYPEVLYDILGDHITHDARIVRQALMNYDSFRSSWLPDDENSLVEDGGLFGSIENYWDVDYGFRMSSDIVHDLLLLLKENPLDSIVGKYPLIAIDEYHDTNPKQYELIKLLADKTHKLVAVGDRFQNIFEWRGTNTDLLFDSFLMDFDSDRAYLNHSYRYGQTLSNLVSDVITRPIVSMEEHQTEIERFDPKQHAKEDYVVISKDHVQNSLAQFYLYTHTKRKLNKPLFYSSSVAMVSLLFILRYPFNIPNRHFLEKLITSYFLTLINLPFCHLSEDKKEEIYKSIASKDIPIASVLNLLQSHVNCYFYDSNVYDQRFIEGFVNLFDEDLLELTTYEVMCKFENNTQFYRLASNPLLGNQIGWATWQGLKEDALAKGYLFRDWLLQLEQMKKRYSPKVGLQFLTVSEAKGREFDQILVFGVNEQCNKFKGESSSLSRNQFYIATTRVKKQLYFIDCSDDYIFDKNRYLQLHESKNFLFSNEGLNEGEKNPEALEEFRAIKDKLKESSTDKDRNPIAHLIK